VDAEDEPRDVKVEEEDPETEEAVERVLLDDKPELLAESVDVIADAEESLDRLTDDPAFDCCDRVAVAELVVPSDTLLVVSDVSAAVVVSGVLLVVSGVSSAVDKLDAVVGKTGEDTIVSAVVVTSRVDDGVLRATEDVLGSVVGVAAAVKELNSDPSRVSETLLVAESTWAALEDTREVTAASEDAIEPSRVDVVFSSLRIATARPSISTVLSECGIALST
jgi:hypothetical protein